MSYKFKMYKNFAKKTNSTKQPGSATLEYDCDLAEGSGVLTPRILMRGSNPIQFNYGYLDFYKRYYYINNWRYNAGIWSAELQVDPLASWKTQIGQQNLYILRAASAYNGRIVDAAYPIRAGKTAAIGQMAAGSVNPFAASYNTGYFVVGIVNTDTGAIGAVSYYVFTPAQFKTLVNKLMGDVSVYGVTDISDELTKILANPFQYVVSATWLPFSPPTGGSVSTLKIGWWDFNIPCAKLSGYTLAGFSGPTINVPKHPDALNRGYYLLTEPYSEYYLDLPPWGAFSLPADKLVDTDAISCYSSVDCITGVGTLWITPLNSNAIITTIQGQIGVPVELAQLAPSINNALNQAITAAESVTPSYNSDANVKTVDIGGHVINLPASAAPSNSSDNLQFDIKSIVSNVATMIMSKWCPAQTLGNNGGFMAGYRDPKLYAWFAYQTTMDNAEKGRPICDRMTINQLSGFVQCGETDISIAAAYKTEIDMIKTYLSTGFYYE